MATTFNKANNTTGLHLAPSWTQNALISSSYIAQFDSTVTTGISVVANAAAANTLNIGKLKILNPGGTLAITTGYVKYNTTGEDNIAIDMASASVNLNHTARIRTARDITILVGSASNNRILTFNGGVYVESASVTPTVTFDIAAGSSASSSAEPFQFATGARVNLLKKGGGTWYTNTEGGTHVLNSITVESGTVFWNPSTIANTFTVANGLYIGNGAIFKGGQAVGSTFGFISDVSGAGGTFQKQTDTGSGLNSFIVGNTNGIDGYYSGKFETLAANGVITITKTGTNKQTFAGNSTSTWTGGASGVTVNGGVLQIWPGALGAATGNITLTTPGTLELSGTQTLTRNIAGTGDLIQTGSGVLVLSGANTYNGYTRIDQGSITAGSTTAIGSSILEYTSSRPGAFSFGNQTTQTFGGIQGNKDLALNNANNAAVALTLNSSLYDTAYYGRLTGLGSLTKSGTSIFALYSSGALGYSGATNIAGGTLEVRHSAALGGAAALNFTADNARLNFFQNTTLNKTYNFTTGVYGYIGAYSGSTVTLTSGSGGTTATTYIQQTQGIVQTNTTTTYGGNYYIQPDVGTATATTIFRDMTSNASGLALGAIILSNAILELSASTVSLPYTSRLRTSRTNDTNYSLANITLGQGFSSINPNGTTIATSMTFAWPPTTSTSLWFGPLLFGTAYGTSTGKTTISGTINLNGVYQQFYVFNGANANGSTAEISGIISDSVGDGYLYKEGPGRLILSAKNTNTGYIIANSGTLETKYIGLQYGSGSAASSNGIVISEGAVYEYAGSGSQTYSTISTYNDSYPSTFLINGVAGGYVSSIALNGYNFDTIISGAANQNVVMEISTLTGTGNFTLSGSNTWKISGLNPTRSSNTTLVSGSKLILSTEHVGTGVSLGTGLTTIAAGGTLETVTGESQSGKARYGGHLTLGTAGSGAVKAKYKIGNGAIKDAGATTASSFLFSTPTNVVLSNAAIYNGPGEYIIYKYTNTLTGFENLNVTTNIAGRFVSHVRHNTNLKRVYVTLS